MEKFPRGILNSTSARQERRSCCSVDSAEDRCYTTRGAKPRHLEVKQCGGVTTSADLLQVFDTLKKTKKEKYREGLFNVILIAIFNF